MHLILLRPMLNISSIRVFDHIRDPEIPITLRPPPMKIDMRIKDESVEQVDSFKYLGYNISSNMNYCQEVLYI